MIERQIMKALKDGRAYLIANPGYLERFLGRDLGLDTDEVAALRATFERETPDVIFQYPREESKFPLWAVMLANETESTQFLGDEGGLVGQLEDLTLDGSEPEAGAEELASIYTRTYQIITYATHPDVCLAYYELCRWIMTRARQDLKQTADLMRMTFSGSDMLPEERYAPAYLFRRQLTVQTEVVEQITGGQPLRVANVTGIHVNDGLTDSAAMGGVEAHVTVPDGE